MLSATDELCKLLEERGVSYKTNYLHTVWHVGPKLYDALNNLDGTLTVDNLTPEQVIAATLGSETCEQVLTNCNDGLIPPFIAYCGACGAEWGFTPKYCHNCGAKVIY